MVAISALQDVACTLPYERDAGATLARKGPPIDEANYGPLEAAHQAEVVSEAILLPRVEGCDTAFDLHPTAASHILPSAPFTMLGLTASQLGHAPTCGVAFGRAYRFVAVPGTRSDQRQRPAVTCCASMPTCTRERLEKLLWAGARPGRLPVCGRYQRQTED